VWECVFGHGVCKDSPGCLSLASKAICIHHACIVDKYAARVDQGLSFLLPTFVHHLAKPERLGITLAVC
jgi:hypothetical protein